MIGEAVVRKFISPLAQAVENERAKGKKRARIGGIWVKIGRNYAAFDGPDTESKGDKTGKTVRRKRQD